MQPPPSIAARDHIGPQRPFSASFPTPPYHAESPVVRALGTRPAPDHPKDRLPGHASAPDARARIQPTASAAPPVSVHQDDGTTVDAPLLVPYSPLDPPAPATLPAALAAGPPDVSANSALVAETARLTQTFFQSIDSFAQDPHDTDYQHRWLQAQEENDARMRASLGGHAWLIHHRDAQRQAREANSVQNAGDR